MITRKILNNSSWRLPYYAYLVITVIAGVSLLLTSKYFSFNLAAWSIPGPLRIVVAVPAALSAIGLFGLVPERYLGKAKKANISRFVKSPAFRDFLIFWLILGLIQGLFYLIPTIQGGFDILWKVTDIATSIASIAMLSATLILLMGLFTNRM